MPVVEDKYRGTTEYQLVYAELVTAAQYQGVTTYQALAQIMGLPLTGNHMATETGRVIGEISEDETDLGRPMLSALVVGVSGHPGQGFFNLARGLRRLDSEDTEDELRFWEQEKNTVYDTWKRIFKV